MQGPIREKKGKIMKRYLILTLILVLILPISIHAKTEYYLIENNFEQNGTKIQQIMLPVNASGMSPNLNNGDVVIVENLSRSNIITWVEAEGKDYKSFNLPGDVILYRPYGKELPNLQDLLMGLPISPDKATPIISRALRWVDQGQAMWEGGPKAPFSGYITKGDHNDRIDQMAGTILGRANATYIQDHRDQIIEVNPGSMMYIDKKTGIILYVVGNTTYVGEGLSYLTPVKKDWIIGIARVRIPYGSDWTKLIADKTASDIGSILGGIKW